MSCKIRLFDETGFFLRHITRRQAGDLLREDRLREITWHNRFWGYRLVAKRTIRNSNPMLTFSDILANARITDGPVVNEVRVTQVTDKVNAWPEIFDTKAPVIVAGHAKNVVKYTPSESPLAVCSYPKWDASHDLLSTLKALALDQDSDSTAPRV